MLYWHLQRGGHSQCPLPKYATASGLYWFAFARLTIDKTFTQLRFAPSKKEFVSLNYPIKFLKNFQEQMRLKIDVNLRAVSIYPKFNACYTKGFQFSKRDTTILKGFCRKGLMSI